MSNGLTTIEYKSPGIPPSEKNYISTNFPDKNVEAGNSLDDFLKSNVKVGNDIVKVEHVILKYMCGAGQWRMINKEIDSILQEKFSSLSLYGKFAIVHKLYLGTNYESYQVYSSNANLELTDMYLISIDKFHEVFPIGGLKVQEKTMCAKGGKPTTLFVLPGGSNEP
jgi:hypothetical protein